MKKRAFTLIELLIVVAIIGILAAIAIPNFLQAQTRAKVARAQADIRTLATGLETYLVDNQAYPYDVDSRGWPWYITDIMTTPIDYITSASGLEDPFRLDQALISARRYRYFCVSANISGRAWPPCPFPGPWTSRWGIGDLTEAAAAIARSNFGEWKLSSSGPDKTASSGFTTVGEVYDPTNGTISNGDIMRTQKYSDMRER